MESSTEDKQSSTKSIKDRLTNIEPVSSPIQRASRVTPNEELASFKFTQPREDGYSLADEATASIKDRSNKLVKLDNNQGGDGPRPNYSFADTVTAVTTSGKKWTTAGRTVRNRVGSIIEIGARNSLLAPFAKKSLTSPYAPDPLEIQAVHEEIKKEQSFKGQLSKHLDSKVFFALVLVSTVVALFGPDLFVLFVDPQYDYILHGLLTFILGFFFVELVLSWICRPSYRFSFYFWLDFIALLSIIPDLPFIWDHLFGTVENEPQDNLAILRAGKIVRTGTRTTRAVRLLKLVRFARIVRIFRLFRTLGGFAQKKIVSSEIEPGSKASILGLHLADLLGRRVIVGIIVMLLILPHLEVERIDISPEIGLEMLEAIHTFHNISGGAGTEDFLRAKRVYEKSQAPLLKHLNIDGIAYMEQPLDRVRNDTLLLIVTDSRKSYAFFDESTLAEKQAVLNIILTFVLIVMMGTSAYMFNLDVHKNVVRPITRTTAVIRRLAKTLFILSRETEDEGTEEEALEGTFVDHVVDKLCSFFDTDGNAKNKQKKVPSAVQPASVTRNETKFNNLFENGNNTSVNTTSGDDFFAASNQPLANSKRSQFDTFFEDKEALQFFRVFLTAEFAVESLLFVEQADCYKRLWQEISDQHHTMITQYINERAENQVNISDNIRKVIMKHDPQSFPEELYEKARNEIYKQLERDNYPRFKKSPLGAKLVALKEQQENEKIKKQQTKEQRVSSLVVKFGNLTKAKAKVADTQAL